MGHEQVRLLWWVFCVVALVVSIVVVVVDVVVVIVSVVALVVSVVVSVVVVASAVVVASVAVVAASAVVVATASLFVILQVSASVVSVVTAASVVMAASVVCEASMAVVAACEATMAVAVVVGSLFGPKRNQEKPSLSLSLAEPSRSRLALLMIVSPWSPVAQPCLLSLLMFPEPLLQRVLSVVPVVPVSVPCFPLERQTWDLPLWWGSTVLSWQLPLLPQRMGGHRTQPV